MAITTQGDAAWGVSGDTSATGVTGVITDIDIGDDPQMEPQRNEIGAVIKQTLYDRRTEVNVTVEVPAGAQMPKSGEAITIAGVEGYVTRSRVVESNQRYRAFQITAEAYPNCNTVDDKTGGD